MNHTHGVAHTWRVGAHASPKKSTARPYLLPEPPPGTQQPESSKHGLPRARPDGPALMAADVPPAPSKEARDGAPQP